MVQMKAVLGKIYSPKCQHEKIDYLKNSNLMML